MRKQGDTVVLSSKEYEMLSNEYKNLSIKYSDLYDKYNLCKDANNTLKRNVIAARKETAKEIISAMKTMIINRRADERSGLNLIYTTYSPERLFNDISEYVRITVGVEVDE